MRLIDADAIAPKLEGKFNQDMVRYAPTIDALPLRCHVGDTVWVIGTKCLSNMFILQCDMNIDAGKCECNLNREYIVFPHKVNTGTFCAIHELKSPGDFVWGKTVFKTKEEAEAALAERGGENGNV